MKVSQCLQRYQLMVRCPIVVNVAIDDNGNGLVEIVFDDSDNRFPTGHEVILRQTNAMKKDEYSLDKKSASKSRRDEFFGERWGQYIESLLYRAPKVVYVFPHPHPFLFELTTNNCCSKITALTNAKDHERLTLLKEVAGTRV